MGITVKAQFRPVLHGYLLTVVFLHILQQPFHPLPGLSRLSGSPRSPNPRNQAQKPKQGSLYPHLVGITLFSAQLVHFPDTFHKSPVIRQTFRNMKRLTYAALCHGP